MRAVRISEEHLLVSWCLTCKGDTVSRLSLDVNGDDDAECGRARENYANEAELAAHGCPSDLVSGNSPKKRTRA